MSDEDKSQKTEEPTEQKLRKARRKGDVPQSREVGTAMVVASLALALVFVLPIAMPHVVGILTAPVALAGRTAIDTGATGIADTGDMLGGLAGGLGLALAPVLGVMLLAAIAGVLIQGETVVSGERIQPKLSKINPAQGLKRLFSPDTFIEFGKSLAKVALVVAVSAWAIRDLGRALTQSVGLVPETLLPVAATSIRGILISVAVLLVPLAIGDVVWKRAQWRKKQRMTLKEVRDETKDSEGDPQIKGRRQELQRARARQRMAQAVPMASVVLTNPTHYAVALRYEPGRDDAPVCVAKGADLMAARIRELARENGVPMIENRPLARALHDSVEVDARVPVEHWQAVAEIIGFVMNLARDSRTPPPPGSSLRDM